MALIDGFFSDDDPSAVAVAIAVLETRGGPAPSIARSARWSTPRRIAGGGATPTAFAIRVTVSSPHTSSALIVTSLLRAVNVEHGGLALRVIDLATRKGKNAILAGSL